MLFRSKALCFKAMYHVLEEEGMCADVVSPGELYTALAAGFPPERLFFHGNNKTDEDIRYGVDSGIGFFIVDNEHELEVLNAYAAEKGMTQKVLLRVTPGIDPHTLEAINTGRIDCQFGRPIETGQAAAFVGQALSMNNLDVWGFHSHIGSQIIEPKRSCDAVKSKVGVAKEMRTQKGLEGRNWKEGGGCGVG